MCKVLKNIGTVAEHNSKALKLQLILNNDKAKKLALVTYKDGMSISFMEFSKADAQMLTAYLCGHLNYKPEIKAKEVVEKKTEVINANTGIVHTLTTLPSTDTNYLSALKQATKEDLEKAIAQMKEGGRHSTRIKACENALRKKSKVEVKADTKVDTKTEVKKPEPKVVQFPTEDKKPKIIPLVTEGSRTYGECVVKINKELEVFGSDSDSQYVLEGIRELCKVDQDFRNNFMREDKTYADFMEFMFKAAQNGYCVRYGNVGWLDRDKGLALAIEYYNADTEQMKAKEKEERKAEAEKCKVEREKKEAEKKKKGAKNEKRSSSSDNSKKKVSVS